MEEAGAQEGKPYHTRTFQESAGVRSSHIPLAKEKASWSIKQSKCMCEGVHTGYPPQRHVALPSINEVREGENGYLLTNNPTYHKAKKQSPPLELAST